MGIIVTIYTYKRDGELVEEQVLLACKGCGSTEDWGITVDRAFTVCKNCGLCLPDIRDVIDTDYLRQSAPIDKEKDTLHWGLKHFNREHWTK